jgi:hypothetical protein
MGNTPLVEDGYFVRVNMTLTRTAALRIEHECQRRRKKEAGRVPHGRLVTEWAMQYCPPYDGELSEAAGKKPPTAKPKGALARIG